MKHEIKDRLTPTLTETIMLFALTLFISILGNARKLTDDLIKGGGVDDSSETIIQIVGGYFQNALSLLDAFSFAPNAVVLAFWGFIGVLVYSTTSSFIRVAKEVKNDVDIASHYLHPRHYARKQILIDMIIYSLKNTILYACLAGTVYVLFVFFAPLVINGFNEVYYVFSVVNLVTYAFSLLVVAIWLYIAFVFVQGIFGSSY